MLFDDLTCTSLMQTPIASYGMLQAVPSRWPTTTMTARMQLGRASPTSLTSWEPITSSLSSRAGSEECSWGLAGSRRSARWLGRRWRVVRGRRAGMRAAQERPRLRAAVGA